MVILLKGADGSERVLGAVPDPKSREEYEAIRVGRPAPYPGLDSLLVERKESSLADGFRLFLMTEDDWGELYEIRMRR